MSQLGDGQIVSPEALFREYLNEEAEGITEQMRSGLPKDFAAYRELVGELRGMRKAFEHWQRAHGGVNISPLFQETPDKRRPDVSKFRTKDPLYRG